MLSELREEVINFMESNEILSKLEEDEWYEMEDKLVELCEKVSGKKDDTYESPRHIAEEWLGEVASEDEIDDFVGAVNRLEEKSFGDIIRLVNGYFRPYNTDGEIDGLAMELEDYYARGN